MGVVYGAPKEGKTFVAIDVAFHIAAGLSYRGKRTIQGPVIYITCEGQRAFENRVAALVQRCRVDAKKVELYVLATSLTLPDDLRPLLWEIRAQKVEPALIVIDTLNRTMQGSESSDDDMAAYIRALDHIRDFFGCTVLVVHHSGHSQKNRPRGHSSLIGALDTQIAVRRDRGKDLIVAEVELMKDGNEGTKIYSRLEVVDLGKDSDGEPITTCVVVPVESCNAGEEADAKARPLTPAACVALKALQESLEESGVSRPEDHIAPPAATRIVTVAAWRAKASALGISEGNAEAQKAAFRRALRQLKEKGLVEAAGSWAWIVLVPKPADRQDSEQANTP